MYRWLSGLGMVVGFAGLVYAASPHFISSSATVGPDAVLTVAWKEAGLGDTVAIDYTTSATAAATYVCLNGGGKHPQAANKETITAPVSASGTFTSGKNGSILGELVLDPPGPGDFSCPPGQRLALACATYSGVVLSDDTNGVAVDLGGPFVGRDPVAGPFCPSEAGGS